TDLHGGSLVFEPLAPHGSRFTVRLPGGSMVAESPEPQAPPPRSSVCRRILLVEDNEDARVVLQSALEAEAYEVQAASDGAAGLHLAHTFLPHTHIRDTGLSRSD